MLKHALSSSGQGPKGGYIQDPRGWVRPPDGLGRPPEALGRPPESLGRLPDPLIRPPPQLNRTYGGRSATPPHLQANRSFHQPNPYASLPQRNGNLRVPHPFQDPKPVNPYGLNASALSASKHSLGGNSSSVSPLGVASVHSPRLPNGCPPRVNPAPPPLLPAARLLRRASEPGVREMLTSLGLLCLVSLLLALLSLVFMLKISPAQDVRELAKLDQVTVISPDEYVLVYEVTLALCAFSLSLNLCCLLVCSVQFLFSVKLVRDSPDGERTNKYLKKSAFTRVCAVGGFFVSIPVFLTGIILYTFIQFHSTPAIVTSVLIGMGIMFCGCAMVHNVFLWQKEKTNAVRALAQEQRAAMQSREQSLSTSEQSSRAVVLGHHSYHQRSVSPPPPLVPSTMLETPTPPEICTLV